MGAGMIPYSQKSLKHIQTPYPSTNIIKVKELCQVVVLYRAINNYLDQRSLWILKRTRISKSRLSDALDARKYFGLHIPVSI
jgi:hypothetical protein